MGRLIMESEKFIKDHIFVVSVPKYDWVKIAEDKKLAEEMNNKKE